MTAKEIIAGFRSGRLSEEEAVVRLASLYRRRASSASGAETSSSGDEGGTPDCGQGSSQAHSSRLDSISTNAQVVDTRPPELALAGRGQGLAKDDGSALACDIAVIGMSGRFPDAADVEQFWKNLLVGRDCVHEVPRSRWDTDKYYDPNLAVPGKSYSKWAGLVEGIEYFDPLFFNISPMEAEFMDPQQRLFLEEAWHAFEDAGYAPNTLSGTKCGVFVGVSSGDYQFLLLEGGVGTEAYVFLGSIIAILAGRVGYALNLKGPSLAIDTASSSSLVAVHYACQSIRIGESEMALAGGAAILATPYDHILTSKTGALSRTGKCYTFDQRADGFVPSEAVAAIVLKRLDKALQDGDHIYGVIKGSGVNQDGSTNGITAPSSESQKSLQLRVYRECGVDPSTVTYVECHGTATKLGDPIEIAALTETFRAYTPEKQFCAIGSGKTNVGHALAACGIVGLIKVLRCLERKQIPASLHFNNPNKHIAFSESPFYVNTSLRAWETPRLPRRAAINSFGISGTNSHVVLEEFVPPVPLEEETGLIPEEYIAVPISARSELQLKQYAGKMLEYLETAPPRSEEKASSDSSGAVLRKLRQIAYTMQTGRIALPLRLVIVVRGWQELMTELQAVVTGRSHGPHTWIGNPGAPKDDLSLDRAALDLEKSATLNRLLSMAKSWVLGHDVDWASLYTTSRPRRIPLPTYPFAKERYWVPVRGSGTSKAGISTNINDKSAEWIQAVLPRASNQESPSFQRRVGEGGNNNNNNNNDNGKNAELVPEVSPLGLPQDSLGFQNGRSEAGSSTNSDKENRQFPEVSGHSVFQQDSLDFPSLLFLKEKSRPRPADADIDWVAEIEKHRGEKLLLLYERDPDLDAFVGLLREFESALNTPKVFQWSHVKLLESALSLNKPPITTGSSIALDDPGQVRNFLQSLENSGNLPDALFVVPAQDSTMERKSLVDAFVVKLVQKLLLHAPSHSVAGYYCYAATGDQSEFQSEAVAAEIKTVAIDNAKHLYRWIKVSSTSTESQKAALMLRERLAYPIVNNTEFVEYKNEQRMVRFWEQVKNPEAAHQGELLRAGATYCITGNLGNIGLSLCSELSRRYQANIVVAPHTPLSSEESGQMAALQQSGVKVHYVPNRTHEGQLFIEGLVKTAGSIATIRGIIDLGEVYEKQPSNDGVADPHHSSMSMVEKGWKLKPLLNSNANKLKGNCVIIVNASSASLAESWFRQTIEGKIVMVAGEEINSPNVLTANWTDLASGRKVARRLLSETGDIDYVFDLSDLYTEPRSSDGCQYGRIGFYQELIAHYRELGILYFTRGLQAFENQWITMAGSRQAGFVKMLSAEYSHVRAKCIDIDAEFLASSSLAMRVTAEALAAVEETEICYRRGQRFAPYLQSRRLSDGADPGRPGFSVRPNGAYVISGGTNGIGLEIARYLAESGAKNLALMGITALPPQDRWPSSVTSSEISVNVRRKLEKLLQIQAMGVVLDVYSGQLTDREKLASFLSVFRSKAGKIHGVVHSAGRAPDLSNGRFAFIKKTEEDLQRVFEPKTEGLEALYEALSEEAPDFFVAFSSFAAMVPRFGKGISDYAAANAFVDDFVSYQISHGRKYFSSMAWVGWSDVGMHHSETAVDVGELPERRSSAVGLLFNSSQQGIKLFTAALHDGGHRSHQIPCLLEESAFHGACETLLHSRPTTPKMNNASGASDLGWHSVTSDDLSYLSVVDDVMQQAPLDFFVLLSPSPVKGAQGHRQAYHNGFRSAFATYRNELVAQGRRRGATLALQAGPRKDSTPVRSGNGSFPSALLEPQVALSLLEVALVQGGSSVVVSGVHNNEDAASLLAETTVISGPAASTRKERPVVEGDFEQVVAKLQNADREARKQILLEINLDGFSDSQIQLLHALVFENTTELDTEADQIRSTHMGPPGISLREVKALIDAELKSVLRLENTAVSERGSFQQYGLDSISGMQLVSRLEKSLGLEVPPRWLIEYSTIETLSEKIIESQQPAVAPGASGTETAQVQSNGMKQSSEQGTSLREIRAVIDAELKSVLRLENTAVSERGSFQQYGLDSISGMQLVSRLEKSLGLEVPPRWLIEYSTIETLSEKIIESQQPAAA
jgi:3-oxoacyl-(acyl-carrier-protein) synthase/acyl carrier protein